LPDGADATHSPGRPQYEIDATKFVFPNRREPPTQAFDPCHDSGPPPCSFHGPVVLDKLTTTLYFVALPFRGFNMDLGDYEPEYNGAARKIWKAPKLIVSELQSTEGGTFHQVLETVHPYNTAGHGDTGS
jgi:hypothetical protein